MGFSGRGLAGAGALVLASMVGVAAQTPPTGIVARGEYLARAGDCVACHTAPGGQPYAGGLMIDTPFGGISTPNITPDRATGIGAWSDGDFYRAMHDGIGRNDEDLYPAFPYPSFTKVTRDDVLAIKAYLFSLTSVTAPRKPNTLVFPFNIRRTLGFWREMFFRPGTFTPNPAWSAQVNRGAYLVEGLGHCGACHTPRNVLGATERSKSLAGAVIDGWFAPNISSDMRQGIGGWSDAQLVAFLKTGASPTKGVVFGPMGDVVHDSLKYLTGADIDAVVAYLRTTPDRSRPTAPAADPTKAQGAVLYLDNCAQCHKPMGRGTAGVVPDLAGNAAVDASAPNDVVMAILNGLPGAGSYGPMPSFAGALDDIEVAAVANYVRTAWSNRATPDVTPALVADLRRQSNVTALGRQASVALGCPQVSPTGAAGQLTSPAGGVFDFLKTETADTLPGRVGEIVATLRARNPGMDPALMVDALVAVYCPLVAADSGLSMADKRARVRQFSRQVTQTVYAATLQSQNVERILVDLPLPPEVLDKVDQAAGAARVSRDAWIEEAIRRALPKPPK